MCLLAVANRCIPGVRVLIAANRDEFFVRPTAPAGRWHNGLVGGRDLKAGGGWLLLRPGGGFAALTNIRRPEYMLPSAGPSRGHLVVDGARALDAEAFVRAVARSEYAGFNLLVEDRDALWVVGTDTAPRRVTPGVHGLSNATIDAPWPKTQALCAVVRQHGHDPEALFTALRNPDRAPDAALPHTGVPLDLERGLSAAFVRLPGYGTRVSTVAWIHDDGRWGFIERRYSSQGEVAETRLS